MGKEIDRSITFTDECGDEVTFILLDLISYKGEEFIVLIPPNENEVIILRIDEEGGEEEAYVSVDDDELLEQLFAIFKERNEDEYNFID